MRLPPETRKLLDWYGWHARVLPWRDTSDPYRIWIAEIMLQQTRVETVIPYYRRWLERFPGIADLARSSQEEVLAAWEGLGYYSRARNLHRAARIVVEKHAGRMPERLEQLLQLPGIGASTAADILSIAYGQDLAALDGNIKRVTARLAGIQHPLDSREFLQECRSHLDALLPKGQAGIFNQALMDLGASICLPRNPDCPACPLRDHCRGLRSGAAADLPVPKPKKPVPLHTLSAAVLWKDGGQVLLVRRPQDALLGGLWGFPDSRLEPGETAQEALARSLRQQYGVEIEVGTALPPLKHAYTHFRVTLYPFGCRLQAGSPHPGASGELRWVAVRELGALPMGKLDRMLAAQVPALIG